MNKKNVKKVTKATEKKPVKKSTSGLTLTKPGVEIKTVESMAGTEASYLTVPGSGINVRLMDDGERVRIHIQRDALRMRDSYVAIDVPSDVLKALVYALLKG